MNELASFPTKLQNHLYKKQNTPPRFCLTLHLEMVGDGTLSQRAYKRALLKNSQKQRDYRTKKAWGHIPVNRITSLSLSSLTTVYLVYNSASYATHFPLLSIQEETKIPFDPQKSREYLAALKAKIDAHDITL